MSKMIQTEPAAALNDAQLLLRTLIDAGRPVILKRLKKMMGRALLERSHREKLHYHYLYLFFGSDVASGYTEGNHRYFDH